MFWHSNQEVILYFNFILNFKSIFCYQKESVLQLIINTAFPIHYTHKVVSPQSEAIMEEMTQIKTSFSIFFS